MALVDPSTIPNLFFEVYLNEKDEREQLNTGNCAKRHDCPYLHNKPEKSCVCKHWLQSLCKKGKDCTFLHQYDLARMPVCQFYSRFKECNNGEECLYLHVEPKEIKCPYYLSGYCPLGPKCKRTHVQEQACEDYLLGFCPRGLTCPVVHIRDIDIEEYERQLQQEQEQWNQKNQSNSVATLLGNPANAATANRMSMLTQPVNLQHRNNNFVPSDNMQSTSHDNLNY